jgi:peptide/nickel transport system substrate-binding protein
MWPSFTGGMVSNFRSAEAVEMMDWARDTLWPTIHPQSINYEFMQEPLLSGEVLVAFDHTARLIEAFNSEPDNFVAFPAPAGGAGRGFMPVIVGLGIPEGATNVEGAQALIDYLTQPEIQGRVLNELGFFPVVGGVDFSDLPEGVAIEAGAVTAQASAADALPALLPVGLGERGGEINQIFRNAFDRIVLDGEDVATVLDEEGTNLEALMNETGAPCWAPDPPSDGPCPVNEMGAAPPPAVEVGVMIIGTTDKVTVLDPADSYDFHTWEIHHNTMDTLLHYVPGTTDLEPGLATDYEVSDDGLEYTFFLVEGASFPDGTPFDAEAVKWSIDRVMRLEGDPNWLVTSFVESVEVVDEYTVKFNLLAPVNYFPLLMATQPYSPISPNCYSEDEFDADSMCSGVGPYTITSWERDVEMVLEAYDGYPGTPPATPKIIVKYYADATTMRLAVESGEIDLATKTLNPTDYADLEAAGELQVIEGPGAQIRYVCFNVTTPPFDQAELRQAISYAADRDAVTSIAFQGTHVPLYSMVPMGMWSHTDSFPERDVDQAIEMLTALGYSEDNQLAMDLWWTPTHYGPTEADVATVLKDNLEETGLIEVSLQNTEWATYKEYINAGSMPVFLLGWYPDYLDPDNYTWSFAHSEASDDIGIFYASDEMDALLEAGQVAAELRGDDRRQNYEDAQDLWAVDIPTIPLTQGSLLVVAQPGVQGIVLDPNMLFHYFLLAK